MTLVLFCAQLQSFKGTTVIIQKDQGTNLTFDFDMTIWSSLYIVVLIGVCCWKRIQSICPNLCSGHGFCGDYDICSCFEGSDGTPAWTGYDCSLRICPRYLCYSVMLVVPFICCLVYPVQHRGSDLLKNRMTCIQSWSAPTKESVIAVLAPANAFLTSRESPASARCVSTTATCPVCATQPNSWQRTRGECMRHRGTRTRT